MQKENTNDEGLASSPNDSNAPVGGSTVKPDCSRHKKEVAGIADMKVLAEMIGDLHYESLSELFKELSKKFNADSLKDFNGGRTKLGMELLNISSRVLHASEDIERAWKISKPYMK